MADTVVTVDRLQIRRSSTAGYRPGVTAGSRPLDDGEEFVNYTDGVRLIGDGETPAGALPEYPLVPAVNDVVGLPTALDGKVDTGLSAQGGLVARPTVGKVRERRSLLDFIPASLHDAILDGTIPDSADLSAYLAAARNYAVQPRTRLVIPSGVYPYSASPNWAGNHVRVLTEGEVRLRYTGTGVAFVVDAGANLDANGNFLAVPGKADMQFGPLIIEATSTALDGAFIRAIHHSMFDLNVRGCGANSAALSMQFGVCSTVHLTVSGNQAGQPAADGSGGTWYKGAKPKIGLLLEARRFNGDVTTEPVSYCEFPRPIIEHVGQGAVLRHSLGSQLLGGTIEGCTEFGARVEATAHDNTIHLVDFEANNGSDLYVAGKDNKVSMVNSLGQKLDGTPNDGLVIDAAAQDTDVLLGKFNTIQIINGAKRTHFAKVAYNRYANGFYANGGSDTSGGLYNAGANTWSPAQSKKTPLTLGGTTYTYTNNTPVTQVLAVSGGASVGLFFLYGGVADGIGATNGLFYIPPGAGMVINYASGGAPTAAVYAG